MTPHALLRCGLEEGGVAGSDRASTRFAGFAVTVLFARSWQQQDFASLAGV